MRFLFALLFVFFLIPCSMGQVIRVSLPENEKFSPGDQVECTKGPIPRGYVNGKKNGVEYRYSLSDVRGTVEGARGSGTGSILGVYGRKNWGFQCHKSEKSGRKFCNFYREGITIVTYVGERNSVTWIAATNFDLGDGKLNMFADVALVDGVEVYNSRNKKFSTEALSLMRSGKLLTLRRGPDPEGIVNYELYGFNEALELCEWALTRIK